MSLVDLSRLVLPPQDPVWAGKGDDWGKVEQALGTSLPMDYHELIGLYGHGTFCNTLEIFSPFGPAGLKTQQESRREYFSSMASCFPSPQTVPRFGVYPEKGGILVVGGDEFMGFLTWQTEGPPDQWPLIWFDDYMANEETFTMRLTDFLVEWVSGRLTPKSHAGRFEHPPLERAPFFSPAKR